MRSRCQLTTCATVYLCAAYRRCSCGIVASSRSRSISAGECPRGLAHAPFANTPRLIAMGSRTSKSDMTEPRLMIALFDDALDLLCVSGSNRIDVPFNALNTVCAAELLVLISSNVRASLLALVLQSVTAGQISSL